MLYCSRAFAREALEELRSSSETLMILVMLAVVVTSSLTLALATLALILLRFGKLSRKHLQVALVQNLTDCEGLMRRKGSRQRLQGCIFKSR